MHAAILVVVTELRKLSQVWLLALKSFTCDRCTNSCKSLHIIWGPGKCQRLVYSDEERSSAEDEEEEDDSLGAEVAHAWHGGESAPGETPWPAYRALREWRQAGRECHLYAYAPYTRFCSTHSRFLFRACVVKHRPPRSPDYSTKIHRPLLDALLQRKFSSV